MVHEPFRSQPRGVRRLRSGSFYWIGEILDETGRSSLGLDISRPEQAVAGVEDFGDEVQKFVDSAATHHFAKQALGLTIEGKPLAAVRNKLERILRIHSLE